MIVLFVFLFLPLECIGLLESNVEECAHPCVNSQLAVLNTSLLEKISVLQAKVDALENKISSPEIAFLTELKDNVNNPIVGSHLVFENVHLNDGNGYNSVHGVFTAPVSGVYHFTLELSSSAPPQNDYLRVYMMKSGETLGYVYLQCTGKWEKGSATSTIHLEKGGDIWIKVITAPASSHIYGCCYHSIFSGFLVKAD